MDLDLRHLRLLVAVADTGSLSGAARLLGQQQPAVSTQLRRIENALGGSLFARSARGVDATELGASVLRRARSILDLVGDLGPRPAPPGLDRLLVRTFVLPFELLLPLLARVAPTVRWDVRAGTAPDGLDAVAAGRADLYVGLRWEDEPGPADLVVDEVVHEHAWVLLPADHPAAALPSVDLRSLSREGFVGRSEPELHRALLRDCRRAGFEPDVRLRATDDAALRAVVRAGAGVALHSPVADVGDGLVLRPCPDTERYSWVVAHRPGRLPPDLLRTMADLLRWVYARRARGNPRLHQDLAPEVLHAPFPERWTPRTDRR